MTGKLGSPYGMEGWKSAAVIASCVSISLLSTFVASQRYRKWALDRLRQSQFYLKYDDPRNDDVLVPQAPKKVTEVKIVTEVTEVTEVNEVNDVNEVNEINEVNEVKEVNEVNEVKEVAEVAEVTRVTKVTEITEVDFDDDDIIAEQFTRNIQFYGMEGQKKVYEAMVVVIGLGGVGSHAATMLLRAGVGKLRLIDFDQVSLSSLNRHAVATREDVGTSKAVCLQTHFDRIFPECKVDARVQMFDPSTSEDILSGSPDFVLDCIDNIDTKVALLASCFEKGIRVLSATGAGARADPTRIRIADLSESSTDPLSRSVRHRLRRKHGIKGGIPVVFSTERPKAKLLPFTAPDWGSTSPSPSDFQVVPGFRVRTIPVLGTIPAIFGQVMASYVVTSIAGLLVKTEPVVNLDLEHYGMLHQRLLDREEILFGSSSDVEVDKEEVAYLVREVWRGRSARNQRSQDVGRGMWQSMKTLTLTRWDRSQPPSIANLVLLSFAEAEEHEESNLYDLQEREPMFCEMVEGKLSLIRQEFAI